MVTITKGGDTHVVSKGAFENYFEPLGYTIVDAPKKIEEKPITENFKKVEAKVVEEKKDDKKAKKAE